MADEKKRSNAGRPLKFKSAEELQKMIDAYFANCDKKKKPYTITGLALALDTTRETLLDYEERDEFSDTIKRAKLRCQAYAEEQLFTNRNTAGVIFNMVNNYGWKNKQDIDNNIGNKDGKPFETAQHVDLRGLSAAELAQLEAILSKTQE
jgi:hypothetical protein